MDGIDVTPRVMTFDYSIFLTHPLHSLTYLLMVFALVSLWLPHSFPFLAVFFLCGFLAGLCSHVLEIVSATTILLLLLASWAYDQPACRRWQKWVCGALCFVVSVGLFTHLFPGFHNWKVLSDAILSPGAATYTMRLNFDKPTVALALIVFGQETLQNKNKWRRTILQTLRLAAIGIPLLIGLAYSLALMRFDPKFPEVAYIWMGSNLLFTCVPEEAFFRGFLQKTLVTFLNNTKAGAYVGILIVSLLFGVAHYAGGFANIALASVAGLFYGYAYHKTNAIEASIAIHFLFNVAHFTLFTYPALATASCAPMRVG
jgi:uncharacterized protein